MNWEDFVAAVDSNMLIDAMYDDGNLEELMETGSVTIRFGERRYVISVKAEEVQ